MTTERWKAIAQLRSTIRDECRQDLASRQRAESAVQAELARIQGALDQWQAEARQALGPTVDLRRLQHARAGIAALSCQHQQVLAQCAEAGRHAEQGRQALLAADRDVKVLERLEERTRAEALAHEARQEIAQLDEIASQRRSA